MPRTAKNSQFIIHDEGEVDDIERLSYTSVLLTQGKHRFYTLAMPSEVLAETCVVDVRKENPEMGFQRTLDPKRAQEIADYIDTGFGTIPSSIIVSAQPDADLQYVRRTRTINFRKHPRAFLIIDWQHRVFGFRKAKTILRVPVVIYNGLSRAEECRLFIDINTKQRPVPSELLLDIKNLANSETDTEALSREIFDKLNSTPESPLYRRISPAEKKIGKLSRVTFNSALKHVLTTFDAPDSDYIYKVMSAYLQACLAGLRQHKAEAGIVNPTIFRALLMLFPLVAERVADKSGNVFTADSFAVILSPMFGRMKKSELSNPGKSPNALCEAMRKTMSSGFTIGKVSD